MAKTITGLPAAFSRGNIRGTARPGTAWKGFAAPLQPRRAPASINTGQWAWVVKGWAQLDPGVQARWNALAPAPMSGYALYVQAGMRAAKRGATLAPAPPSAYPNFTLITAPVIAVDCSDLHLLASWAWPGGTATSVLLQVAAPQTQAQLYVAPKSWYNVLEFDPALLTIDVTNPYVKQFGQLPSNCWLSARWVHVDYSGITGPSFVTRTQFGVC
jgi:hypothetical protein